MNTTELRKKTKNDLNSELGSLLKEQFNLRVQRGLGQKPAPHRFRNVRRQIARIKTLLREKEEGSS